MTRPPGERRGPEQEGVWEASTRVMLLLLIIVLLVSVSLIIDPRASSYLRTKTSWMLLLISILLVLGSVRVLPSAVAGRSVRFPLPPLFFPLAALLVASALSTIHARNPVETVASLGILTCAIVLYTVVALTVRSAKEWGILLGSLLAVGGVISMYALLQYFRVLPSAPAAEGADAMIATLGNVNYVAQFTCFLVGPSLILVLSGRPVQRLLGLLCFGLFMAVFILARSWGAWLGAVAALALLALTWITTRQTRPRETRRCRTPWALIVLCVVGGLAIASLALAFPTANGLPSLAGGEAREAAPEAGDVSVVGEQGNDHCSIVLPDEAGTKTPPRVLLLRLANWWMAWEMFIDHPVLGVGLGNYKLNFLTYKARLLENPTFSGVFDFYVPQSVQAHNDPLQWVAETGSIGLAAMLWVLFSLAMRMRGLRSVPRHLRWRYAGVLGGIVAVLIVSLASFPLHRPAASLVLMALVGLLDSRAISEELRSRPSRAVHLSRWSLRMAIPVIVAISVALGVGVCRDYRSDLLLEAGRRTIERGNLVGALALFEKSRALAFRPAEALFYLGFTSLQGGDAQQAAAYLERSLRDRVTEDTYLFLAQAYAQVGNVEEAWEVLDRLLATEPHPSRKVLAYYLRAQLLQATGNYDMAVAQLGHVLSQGPPLLRIQAHLLTADIHVELGRPDLAAESYQRALDETAAELAKKSGVRVFLLNSPSVPIAELAEVDEDIAWLEDAFRRAHEGLVEVGKEAY